MKRLSISPELLISPKQREEIGVANDYHHRVRLAYERLAGVAGRACLLTPTEEDTPLGWTMEGEYTISPWRNIGLDTQASAYIHGRLHHVRNDATGFTYATIVSEAKLVAPRGGGESFPSVIASMSDYEESQGMPVQTYLGAFPTLNLYMGPNFLPIVDDLVSRFDVANPPQEG